MEKPRKNGKGFSASFSFLSALSLLFTFSSLAIQVQFQIPWTSKNDNSITRTWIPNQIAEVQQLSEIVVSVEKFD